MLQVCHSKWTTGGGTSLLTLASQAYRWTMLRLLKRRISDSLWSAGNEEFCKKFEI